MACMSKTLRTRLNVHPVVVLVPEGSELPGHEPEPIEASYPPEEVYGVVREPACAPRQSASRTRNGIGTGWRQQHLQGKVVTWFAGESSMRSVVLKSAARSAVSLDPDSHDGKESIQSSGGERLSD